MDPAANLYGRETHPAALLRSSFPAFALVFAALYTAYGTESPFLPAFMTAHGVSPDGLGAVLAAGTVVRLVAGPAAGRLADRLDAARPVLGCGALLAGALSFAYLPAYGFAALLAISMAHSLVLAPLAPVGDALALAAVARERVFAYGWVRGVGSATFVAGTLASGWIVGRAGLSSIIVSSGLLFLVLAFATPLLPRVHARVEARRGTGGFGTLLAVPVFRQVLLVAALVIGSHAMNDAFAVIRWRAAGLQPGTISLLWSESVASEVVVFFLLGPPLLLKLGPTRCAALAAAAGVIRWAVLASTAAVPVLAAVQLTHGLTFALLHLSNMRLIGKSVPDELSATAQTLYATLGQGVASAVFTLASGWLYGRFGAHAFWSMALLCALALPLTRGLRDPVDQPRDAVVPRPSVSP